MALIFERIQTDGIAELSYLVGDDSEGVAAVIDPRPDVECYLKLAREKQVSITHVFEIHIHAGLVSGARELCARVETAKIFVSHEGGCTSGRGISGTMQLSVASWIAVSCFFIGGIAVAIPLFRM